MDPFADYAILVLCAGDVDTIWGKIPGDKSGPPALPAAGDQAFAYVTAEYFDVLGQLRCNDLFISEMHNVYYGLLLRCRAPLGPMKPGDYLVAVRGTMTPLEWANDATAEFPRQAPGVPGMVGTGFWDVYASMTYGDLAGANQKPDPALEIATVVKANPGSVFLTGHSLGAALGTYLARDLAAQFGALTPNVPPTSGIAFSPYFFASPKTGSQDYVDAYQGSVATYTVCNFAADLVPMLPSSPPFMALNSGGPTHDVHIIPADAQGSPPWPRLDLGKNHSPAYYAHMLDLDNAAAIRLLP